ncbi:MAG: hypothetical protein CM15mP32_5880 [Flavobacteriaceae bacterium]|nr:MAG: hypothetical protein CM15mP32_5880 [Flavobacteriaceae bacterium]
MIQKCFKANGRTDTENKYFDFTKQLFNWRKSEPVIHHGKTMHYAPQNEVMFILGTQKKVNHGHSECQ